MAEAAPGQAEIDLRDLLEPQGVSSDLLSEVLRWRLAKADCNRGVVLDDLVSRFVGTGTGAGGKKKVGGGRRSVTARVVAAAMPSSRLLVLRIEGDDEG